MSYFKDNPIYSTNNLDELTHVMERLAPSEKLYITKSGKEVDFSLRLAQVGRIQLYHVSLGDDVPIRAMAEPVDTGEFSLVALTGGHGRARQHTDECDIGLTKGVMRDRRMPFLVQENGFSAFILSCSPEVLEEHARSLVGDSRKPERLVFDFEVDFTEPKARHLLRTLNFLADEMDDPSFDFSNSIVMGNWENLLLSQLLLTQPNNYTEVLRQRPISGALPKHVKKARDYIHTNAHEHITQDDLTSWAGCSYRALQIGFNDAFGQSPMAYLKTVRLAHIREVILNMNNFTTISDVARKWGFSHMGRFSQAYRQQFGEHPSETLRRRA